MGREWLRKGEEKKRVADQLLFLLSKLKPFTPTYYITKQVVEQAARDSVNVHGRIGSPFKARSTTTHSSHTSS